MLVVSPRLQRLKRLLWNPQLDSRQPLDILDPGEPFEANHWSSVLHAHRRDREPLAAGRGARPYSLTLGKSLLHKIGFGIDHDLAPKAVRTRDASHQGHVLPIRDWGLGIGDWRHTFTQVLSPQTLVPNVQLRPLSVLLGCERN